MNLYFILEGNITEVQVYPAWIKFFQPSLKQVFFEKDVVENNYYIISGGGIPSIYNHAVNAIQNINDNPVFDKLIVCLDAEEIGVEGRIEEINNYIKNSGVVLNSACSLHIVVQNVCIETWFLGNRKIVKSNSENESLKGLLEHYNVKTSDPELMHLKEGFRNNAHFHLNYFQEILKEHKLSYSKRNPRAVLDETFVKELKTRTKDTDHLPTLKRFFDLLASF